MRRLFALFFAMMLFCATAMAAGVGQTYKDFEASYAENIVFINQNTGRMLLPHTLNRDYDQHGKRMYRINRGALSMEMHMDESGERIAQLTVTLIAPAQMQHGDATYMDFATAGYHSYALLMAMDTSATVGERYSVVEQVNWGIKQHGGAYETSVGDYTLTCKSENGVATLHFTNDLLLPKPSEQEAAAPEIDITQETDDDEGNSLAG